MLAILFTAATLAPLLAFCASGWLPVKASPGAWEFLDREANRSRIDASGITIFPDSPGPVSIEWRNQGGGKQPPAPGPRWERGVLNYPDVFPGIGVIYRENAGRLEYDFHVSPGARPEEISIRITGAESLVILPSGDLEMGAGGRVIVQRKPVAWQDLSGWRRFVDVNYELTGNTVRFALGAYDPAQPLVIDPIIETAQLFGGPGEQGVWMMSSDRDSNLYLFGSTVGSMVLPGLPAGATRLVDVPDGIDFYISRIGAGLDEVQYTSVFRLPFKFDPGVNMRMAVSREKELYYAVGITGDFRNLPGSIAPLGDPGASLNEATNQQIFLLKLSPDGRSVQFYTRIACNGSLNVRGLAVDSKGNPILAGDTTCTDFPVTSNGFLAGQTAAGGVFVMRLKPDGSGIQQSALIGGSGEDLLTNMALDSMDRAILLGSTRSPDFPTTEDAWDRTLGGLQDAFLFRLKPDFTDLSLSTYAGGSGEDRGRDVKVDSLDGILVDLWTRSEDLSTTPGAVQPSAIAGQENTALLRFVSSEHFPSLVTYLNFGYNAYSWIEFDERNRAVSIRSCPSCTVTGTQGALFQSRTGSGTFFALALNDAGSEVRYSTWLPGGGQYYGTTSVRRGNGQILVGTAVTGWPPPLPDGVRLVSGEPDHGRIDVWLALLNLEDATACSTAIADLSFDISPRGETREVPVSAPPGCPWMAHSGLTETRSYLERSAGIGAGTVRWTIPPFSMRVNTSSVVTFSLNEHSVAFRQSAPTCEDMVFVPGSLSFPKQGGVTDVVMQSPGACALSPADPISWLSASVQAVNGKIPNPRPYRITAGPNDFPARSATLRIGSATLSVAQDSGHCTATLSPASVNVGAHGGTVQFSLQPSSETCRWDAVAPAPLGLQSAASGTGSATIAVSVPQTDEVDTRTLVLQVAGREASLIQQGGTCTVTAAAAPLVLPASGGAATMEISVSGTACGWYPLPSTTWISVTRTDPMNSTFTMRVEAGANLSGAARSASVRALGRSFTVQQAAINATLLLTTTPVRTPVRINGVSLAQTSTAPLPVEVEPESTVTVTADASVPIGDGDQLRWESWASGMPLSHSIAAPASAESVAVHANFRHYFRVSAASTSAAHGSILRTPASADSYHAEGSTVVLKALPAPGYRFVMWEGAGGNTNPELTFHATAPLTLVARFALIEAPLIVPTLEPIVYTRGQAPAAREISVTATARSVPLKPPVAVCVEKPGLLTAALDRLATPATLTLALVKSVADDADPGNYSCTVALERSDGELPATVEVPVAIEIRVATVVASLDAVVDAASYRAGGLAAGSIASAFGTNLASESGSASSLPLPESLHGAQLRLSTGSTERTLGLFYVSPTQINFLLPEFLAAGPATLTLLRNGQIAVTLPIVIEAISPAIFSANVDGKGAPAGFAIRTQAGQQASQNLAVCPASGACTPATVIWGDPNADVYLVLFGTGFRGLTVVKPLVTIGGTPVEVTYCGPQPQFAGLDQINLRLPAGLRGRGELELKITHGEREANPLRLRF